MRIGLMRLFLLTFILIGSNFTFAEGRASTHYPIVIALLAGDNLPMDSLSLVKSHTSEAAILFSKNHPEGMPTEYCGQAEMTFI